MLLVRSDRARIDDMNVRPAAQPSGEKRDQSTPRSACTLLGIGQR